MEINEIKQLRLECGQTQAEFAARLNVSQITVGYWESGRSRPSKNHIVALNVLKKLSLNAPKIEEPSFRAIQYLGSKARLAATITNVINSISPVGDRVGDLFAGTGVVSRALAQARPVTSVDIQAYSTVLTRALLQGQPPAFSAIKSRVFWDVVSQHISEIERLAAPLLSYEAEALEAAKSASPNGLISVLEYGSLAVQRQRAACGCPIKLSSSLDSVLGLISKGKYSISDLTALYYFGGAYFSYRQAIELDAIYIAAKNLSEDVFQAASAVILSCASEIVNTVGKQFAQPMRLQKADGRVPPLLLNRALRDRSLSATLTAQDWAERWSNNLSRSDAAHDVFCGDVNDFLKRDDACSVYYADPPYTIDHYSRFYHVLETLVLRDSPRLDEMKKGGEPTVMRGLYRADRFQSPFCVPSTANKAFKTLISNAAKDGRPLVLSYSPFDIAEGNRSRLMDLDGLIEIGRSFYNRVNLVEVAEHSHRKLNAKINNSVIKSNAECLIVCEV